MSAAVAGRIRIHHSGLPRERSLHQSRIGWGLPSASKYSRITLRPRRFERAILRVFRVVNVEDMSRMSWIGDSQACCRDL